jgi:hypothetical protein
MRTVADQTGGQVRNGSKAGSLKRFSQLQRRIDAFRGRRCDGDCRLRRQIGRRRLSPFQRYELERRLGQDRPKHACCAGRGAGAGGSPRACSGRKFQNAGDLRRHLHGVKACEQPLDRVGVVVGDRQSRAIDISPQPAAARRRRSRRGSDETMRRWSRSHPFVPVWVRMNGMSPGATTPPSSSISARA